MMMPIELVERALVRGDRSTLSGLVAGKVVPSSVTIVRGQIQGAPFYVTAIKGVNKHGDTDGNQRR